MTYPSATATLPTKYNLCPPAIGGTGPNYITPVRDQGTCNSCTAYAVVAAIEGAISIKNNITNPTLHLSEAQLFNCAGPGCETNAWYPEDALTYCRDVGITTAALYGPGSNGVCYLDDNWPITKIAAFERLPDATAIKQCLTGTGPYPTASPVVTLFVYYKSLHDWAPPTHNQFYRFKDNDPHDVRIGGHAVCIVGYDDTPGYWICKNSWGAGWGGAGDGFFNIAYGDCYVDSYRMYGVVLP
jgi:Papain family cysteine protease